MTKRLFTRALLVLFLLGGFFAFTELNKAQADSVSYLYRLGGLGYRGSDARWLTTGEWICTNQWRYSDYQMAYAIMTTTGSGIYMAEGYEIIDVARQELC